MDLMNFPHALLFLLFFIFICSSSCKNKNVTEDVQRYCDCLDQHQHNPDGRETCLDLMDEMKTKYAGDNRALMQILEETDGCL